MRSVRFINSLDGNETIEYDTWLDFDSILNAEYFSPPEAKTYTIDIPGGNGTLDLSTALTDGETVYNDRSGTIKLIATGKWSITLNRIINALHGQKMYFKLPDDEHWLYGRITVSYDNMVSYAIITLNCVCDPWKYAKDKTDYIFDLSENTVIKKIHNGGGKRCVPELSVIGDVTVTISDGTATLHGLKGGQTYMLPEIPILPGNITLSISSDGVGKAVLSFREAIL